MNLIEMLEWRYAAKRMNGQAIPQEKLDRILEAIRLSASSAGLQPYEVLVIANPALKEAIKPIANNQPQITESSHLLVFAAWNNVSADQIAAYIDLIAAERGVSAASLAPFSESLKGNLLSRSPEANFNWAARSTFIGLGTGLIAAAAEGVDATPMEGFNPAALDELLGLQKDGLRSVALMALGYRDAASDFLAKAKKVRKPAEQLFRFL